MKYKPGDKFIIEIERCIENCKPPTYRMKNCMFSLSETTLCTLEPYSKEAEYKRGLNDAWEAARKILTSDWHRDIQPVFIGMPGSVSCITHYPAAEAIDKLRAYEEAQEIHVGDEVIREPNGEKGVVWKCHVADCYGRDKYIVLNQYGTDYCLKDWIKKTGRHFPEVAALLDKMKGETDESN